MEYRQLIGRWPRPASKTALRAPGQGSFLTEPSAAEISPVKILQRNEPGLAISLDDTVVGTKRAKTRFAFGNLKVFSGRGTVMHFVIAGFLVGVLLALLRFKVLVLVPTILIAASAIIVTSHELKVIALTILATVALLQIGYLVGCTACVYADAHIRV
jgi:hypothetical protein